MHKYVHVSMSTSAVRFYEAISNTLWEMECKNKLILVQIKFEIHTCKGTLNSLLKMNVVEKT